MGGVCTSWDEEIRAREGCDVVTNIKKGSREMMSGTVNVGLSVLRGNNGRRYRQSSAVPVGTVHTSFQQPLPAPDYQLFLSKTEFGSPASSDALRWRCDLEILKWVGMWLLDSRSPGWTTDPMSERLPRLIY
jgi:hypothetical protein